MIPIRTNITPRRTPYTNYALIIANAVIFLLSYAPHVVNTPMGRTVEPLRNWADHFMLAPNYLYLWQFITYAFLHGGWMHIIANMWFLYLFGNNVNERFGHIGYLSFYLAGAVFSGIGHTLMSSSPVLGASGAVAAVTGAYLALFPQSVVTIFYWLFFFIGTLDVSAFFFIVLKLIVIDNMIARTTPNVAYDAHLAGYFFGTIVTVGLLAIGLLKSDYMDLWSMIKQWNQRRRYRDVVSSGFDPFTGNQKRTIKVKEVKKTPRQKQYEKQIVDYRQRIARRIGERNLTAAAQLYLELIALDPDQLPPKQYLLDISNQLVSDGKYDEAARAYEKFIANYGNYDHIEQVQLMLGVIYARYLDQPQAAVRTLEKAAEKLDDPGQKKMCEDELKNLHDRGFSDDTAASQAP